MRPKPRVLIVDDQDINRMILRKYLVGTYNVVEASNGEEAWQVISEQHNELSAVLLDLVMPEVDGYAVLKKIKQAKIEELPIIVTTGLNDAQTEQKALDEGAWDFVSKPYSSKVLLCRLKNAIARSQVAAYEKLHHMSEHDALTGLHNRSKMFSNTRKMLDENLDKKFAFARIDIDRFALFNTSFGEEEGDKLLKYFSQIVQKIAERYTPCTYGRINADVFCTCFVYDGDGSELKKVVNEAQRYIACYKTDYLLEISVGVCEIEDNRKNVDDFYLDASLASLQCKHKYATHISFYDKDLGLQLSKDQEITSEMQWALDNDQFIVYFQPKYTLKDERPCGAEALVRWQHPEKGLISPGEFIPVFERNGFISKVDHCVWEKTCQMLHFWIIKGADPLPVSINISRMSLYNPGLVDDLIELVTKYEVPPHLLELEITESTYMTNPDLMEETITALHKHGFIILMDDFGSGYSSLNTLKEINVDVLKIDMKFLPVKNENGRAEIILASMIRMATWLGMGVIVEGVETKPHRDFLEGAGCNCVQGYYYSRPIPSEQYEKDYVFANLSQAISKRQQIKNEALSKSNMTILIIDDSVVDLNILTKYFSSTYNVKTCESAEEGLAYLLSNMNKVKLILIDNYMPGMSGMEFLRHCNHNAALSVIPKIMITANESVWDQVEAFDEGAYDYITKPFVKEVIIARVDHVMEITGKTAVFEILEKDYKQQTDRDSATKLLHKMAFRELSTRLIENLPEDQKVLFVIDIDDFKQVNDQYGHLSGDDVIRLVADELTNAFRKTDVIGRFGGDEFVVLMTKLHNKPHAKRKAEEVIKSIFFKTTEQLGISTSVSVGLAFSEENDTIDTLFERADQALYEAKSSGKGKVVVSGEKMASVDDIEKPLVLVCTKNSQMCQEIAFSYGDTVAFAWISSFKELADIYEKYAARIKAVCIDMEMKSLPNFEKLYKHIVENNDGGRIKLYAICQEGNMPQFKSAVGMKINELLTVPLQMDVVQRRLSHALIDVL